MAFFIPDTFNRFSNEVFSRFRVLLSKNVFNGITQLTLREWLSNFNGEEEQYLAAHLLDALVYRTDLMVNSSLQHIIEMILPRTLKEYKSYYSPDIDSFIHSLSTGDLALGLRFVAVDGIFDDVPGKSGAQIIRHISRGAGIHNRLLLRPENMATLEPSVKTLIFIDDCLGTGTQFKRFSKAYDLPKLSLKHTLIYIPLLAHPSGVLALKEHSPFLHIDPVEELRESSNFFCGSSVQPEIWLRDRCNSVADVKDTYYKLIARHGVRTESEFCLNLSIGFSFSTPNNTLKAYFSNQGTWKNLLVR